MKKIGIALSGQAGDIISATSVFAFKDELWGADTEITWLADERYYDIFKFNPYLIVKQFPHGWQISEQDKATIYAERIAKDIADGKPAWEDLSLAKNYDGTVNQELKHQFESIKIFDQVYFPAPWQATSKRRTAQNYPLCSKKVFGVPDDFAWHPVLFHSPEERIMAKDFIDKLPPGNKIILFETYCGSQQSKLTHEMVLNSMRICEEQWGKCNFIFVSHKYLNAQPEFPENFFTETDVSAAHFTPRQAALLANYCDLFISVSSGISVASSCWGTKPYKMIQYCGSAVCGTKELAIGECVQVFSDDKADLGESEFYDALNQILNKNQ